MHLCEFISILMNSYRNNFIWVYINLHEFIYIYVNLYEFM
jgi:hypothetical protein